MEAQVNIDGVDKLMKTMGNVPKATRKKASRQALREGATVIKDMATENVQAIANSGYATGALEKNLRVYSLKQLRGNLRVAVMVRRGAFNIKKLIKGAPVRIGLYASVLEYGKKGQPPRSWIRKAAREGASKAYAVVLKGISKRIDAILLEAKK